MTLITDLPRGHGGWGLGFSAVELKRFAIIPTGPVLSSVVPDGVMRVEWMSSRRLAGVNVRDNVAVAPGAGTQNPSKATWYFPQATC